MLLSLPVVVIGGGPIGLAAAVHLLERGVTPLVLEAGDCAGAAMRAWGHVRLFSPWKYLVDPGCVALLEPTGWRLPDPERAPTGAELADGYVEPLARLPRVAPYLRLRTRVLGVSRLGQDKLKSPDRASAPFVLRAQTADASEERVLARGVIDASGTYLTPNPLGADGLPAIGEAAARARIAYGIPDVLDGQRARYARRHTLVVGAGHSAFNVLLDLASLPDTRVTWAVRRRQIGQLFGGEEHDALPERGRLGTRTRQLLESGRVSLVSVRITEVRTSPRLSVVGSEDEVLGPFDEIVCATGFRPDLDLTRELRLDLDPSVEAPHALAPLIDPNVHSCGTVPPHGARELQHPAEPDFYTVGMKSYGRAPTFLLLTGYEQVRSVAAALAGDWAAARQVHLQLPETGVCSTAETESACCEPSAAPALISLT